MRRMFITLGLLFIALAAAAWLGSDRFANEVLRPWATTKAAETLAAEVSADRLELGWGRLEIHGLRIARIGEFVLKTKQITIDYALAGLWRKRLESVAIHQPEVDWLGSGKPGQQPTAWPELPPLQISAWQMVDGRLRFAWGEEWLLLQRIEATGGLAARFPVEVTALLGNAPGVALTVSGDGRWEGQPELTLTRMLWAERSLLQAPVTVTPGGGPLTATFALDRLDAGEAARLLAAVSRQPPWPPELGWRVTAPRLTVGVDDGELTVRLETAAGEIRRGEDRWPWEKSRLHLVNTAGSWAIDGAATLPAKAQAQLTGTWGNRGLRGRWQLAAPAPAELCQAFGLALPPAARELRELTLAGELQASTESAASADARLTARWRGSNALSGTVIGHWREGVADIEATGLAFRAGSHDLATASFKLSGQPAEKSWQGRWRLQIPDALHLTTALAVTPPAGVPNLLDFELEGELTSAENRLVIPVTGVTGRLAGAGLSGRFAGRLALHQLMTGWRCEVSQLAVTAFEYASPDGLTGLTGGTMQLTGVLEWHQELTFALRGEAGAGEVLAGSWYADLGGFPLQVTAEGGWVPTANQLHVRAARFALADVASTRLEGNLTGTTLDLSGEVTVPRLDGAFQERLQQLAAGTFPGVERLALAGAVSAGITAAWQPDGWTLQAVIRPTDVALGWGEDFHLSGVGGELPLLLRHGTAAPTGDRHAILTWNELRVGPLTSTGDRMRLTAGANRLRLEDPVRLEAGGGRLELAGIALELPPAEPTLRVAVTAQKIDLERISRDLEWPELGGRLDAELPEILVTPDAIGIGGEALLQVFRGEVRTRNMRMEKPFSRYPNYFADLVFTGIDLQQLTQAFAFGEINGIADGFIRDLRLFGTTPAAFDARFETREKGARNISVKALRNLNTLSQGGLSAALSQGIYRFIDYYRYRKIGIRCHLRNDVFHLEGTARPGTTTYLIDGGWLPPRLDVIVSTPTISFQEMVKRLKRIERTGH